MITASALAIAFTAGILSFLSPCIVPMLSVYFTLITGESFRSLREVTAAQAVRQGVLRNTLAFVVGFSLVFTAAGVAAAGVGALLQNSLGVLNLVGGALVIALGLATMGVLPAYWVERFTFAHRDPKPGRTAGRPWSSFLVGLVFAVACSHCIAPTLYSILIFAGGSGSPVTGGALMAAFSVGLAVPYLLASLFLGRAVTLLRGAGTSRVWFQRLAGLLTVGLGVLMITGRLTWLTEIFGRFWSYRPPVGM